MPDPVRQLALPSVVTLPPAVRAQIARAAEAVYPDECCGVLFGRDLGDLRQIDSAEPLDNAADARARRFLISPGQLLAVERRASAEGRVVVGFYHSHPDHPARPSETDRHHAWPFYSYVIVAVAAGLAGDVSSWRFDDTTQEFVRQSIT